MFDATNAFLLGLACGFAICGAVNWLLLRRQRLQQVVRGRDDG